MRFSRDPNQKKIIAIIPARSGSKGLKNEIFHYKDNEKFKLGLEKYLEEGKFYQCTKEESRKYFLQSDDVGSRDQLLHDVLSKIKSSETCDATKG